MTNKKNLKVKIKDKNQHKIKPNLAEAFKGSVIKEIISDILVNVLEGKNKNVTIKLRCTPQYN